MNVEKIKRKLLIKYPLFGSIIASSNIIIDPSTETASTDGIDIYYNKEFMDALTEEEQTTILAHEVSHIAGNHIERRKGKDKKIWNIACDSVINANLDHDGLPLVKGMVDIPEAINYSCEEMYEKLLKENKNNGQKSDDSQTDIHPLWDKAKELQNENKSNSKNQPENNSNSTEEQKKNNQQSSDKFSQGEGNKESDKKPQKKEQQTTESQPSGKEKKQNKDSHQKDSKTNNNASPSKNTSTNKTAKTKTPTTNKEKDTTSNQPNEKEKFKQNRVERRKQLQELRESLASKSHQHGDTTNEETRNITDIGISKPLVDWRRLLIESIKRDIDWSYKNAEIEDGVLTPHLEKYPSSVTEIVLDTSGSVNEVLLKNFLRECKVILQTSKLKVGCFDTLFYGFTEIRKLSDIDNLKIYGGGGTNFYAAISAFTKRSTNKIIFTDGYAPMPSTRLNAIWIVFGNAKIKPIGGKVIYIDEDRLEKLSKRQTKTKALIKK